MRNFVVIRHRVASLVGMVGTALTECDKTQTAEILFQISDRPDSQMIARIPLSDLKVKRRVRAIKRWVYVPPEETDETPPIIVVSEAREARAKRAHDDETWILSLHDSSRITELNRLCKTKERKLNPAQALRARTEMTLELKRKQFAGLEGRDDLTVTEKATLTRLRNQLSAQCVR